MHIKSIETLTIDTNLLNELPEQIGQMRSLTSLSARNNQLSSLPDTVSALVSLKSLNLDSNQLSILPVDALACLTALTSLGLASNQLVTPPFELFRTSTLTSVSLAGNPGLMSPPPRLTNDESRKEEVIEFLRREAFCIRSGRSFSFTCPYPLCRRLLVCDCALDPNPLCRHMLFFGIRLVREDRELVALRFLQPSALNPQPSTLNPKQARSQGQGGNHVSPRGATGRRDH
jgi:hypothetical protein